MSIVMKKSSDLNASNDRPPDSNYVVMFGIRSAVITKPQPVSSCFVEIVIEDTNEQIQTNVSSCKDMRLEWKEEFKHFFSELPRVITFQLIEKHALFLPNVPMGRETLRIPDGAILRVDSCDKPVILLNQGLPLHDHAEPTKLTAQLSCYVIAARANNVSLSDLTLEKSVPVTYIGREQVTLAEEEERKSVDLKVPAELPAKSGDTEELTPPPPEMVVQKGSRRGVPTRPDEEPFLAKEKPKYAVENFPAV
jgi:hypothetical protein